MDSSAEIGKDVLCLTALSNITLFCDASNILKGFGRQKICSNFLRAFENRHICVVSSYLLWFLRKVAKKRHKYFKNLLVLWLLLIANVQDLAYKLNHLSDQQKAKLNHLWNKANHLYSIARLLTLLQQRLTDGVNQIAERLGKTMEERYGKSNNCTGKHIGQSHIIKIAQSYGQKPKEDYPAEQQK